MLIERGANVTDTDKVRVMIDDAYLYRSKVQCLYSVARNNNGDNNKFAQ